MALQVLEAWGAEAEAGGSWVEALEFGQRAVEIEGLYEEGHRRIMRAWAALGDRGLALRHYGGFVVWLQSEVGLDPDPATARLASELRSQPQTGATDARRGTSVPATMTDAAGGGIAATRTPKRPLPGWKEETAVNGNMWTRLVRVFQKHTTTWGLEKLDRRFHRGRAVEVTQAGHMERRP
jgi:hypothetical protein